MSLVQISIFIAVVLGGARAIDLVLSNDQKQRILSAIEHLTILVDDLKPANIFSRIARPPILTLVTCLVVLSSYPLYRSIALPLLEFSTHGEAMAFISAGILSFFAVRMSNEFFVNLKWVKWYTRAPIRKAIH